MKRILALLMAMVIIFSLGAVAFADYTPINTDRDVACTCGKGEVWERIDFIVPTCTENGIEHLKCINTDAEGNPCAGRATRTYAALGHTWKTEQDVVPPTCTETGYFETRCSVCEAVQDGSRTPGAPATGHTPGTPTQENIVPATFEADGSYDEVVRCTVCSAEISRTKTPIPKLSVDLITISPNVCTVKVGGTVMLNATPSYAGKNPPPITWTSLDPGFATVDASGLVTGVAEGTARIQASAGGKSSLANVTVEKAAPPKTTFTVTYVHDGFSNETEDYPGGTYEAGRVFTTRPAMYTRSGYAQTGWVTSSGKAYALNYPYTIYSDLILYPSWTKASNVYTVTVSYSGDLANSGGYIYDSVHGRYYEGESFTMRSDESRSFYVSCDPGYYAFSVKTVGGAGYHNHGSVSNGSYFTVRNPAENKTLFVRFENKTYYPPTGDESNLGLFAALALMSMLGCAAVVTVKKHEH